MMKCDVDPTCCCAEFVDESYAVNVRFVGSLDDDCGDGEDGTSQEEESVVENDSFTSYFAEAEIVKV